MKKLKAIIDVRLELTFDGDNIDDAGSSLNGVAEGLMADAIGEYKGVKVTIDDFSLVSVSEVDG